MAKEVCVSLLARMLDIDLAATPNMSIGNWEAQVVKKTKKTQVFTFKTSGMAFEVN